MKQQLNLLLVNLTIAILLLTSPTQAPGKGKGQGSPSSSNSERTVQNSALLEQIESKFKNMSPSDSLGQRVVTHKYQVASEPVQYKFGQTSFTSGSDKSTSEQILAAHKKNFDEQLKKGFQGSHQVFTTSPLMTTSHLSPQDLGPEILKANQKRQKEIDETFMKMQMNMNKKLTDEGWNSAGGNKFVRYKAGETEIPMSYLKEEDFKGLSGQEFYKNYFSKINVGNQHNESKEWKAQINKDLEEKFGKEFLAKNPHLAEFNLGHESGVIEHQFEGEQGPSKVFYQKFGGIQTLGKPQTGVTTMIHPQFEGYQIQTTLDKEPASRDKLIQNAKTIKLADDKLMQENLNVLKKIEKAPNIVIKKSFAARKLEISTLINSLFEDYGLKISSVYGSLYVIFIKFLSAARNYMESPALTEEWAEEIDLLIQSTIQLIYSHQYALMKAGVFYTYSKSAYDSFREKLLAFHAKLKTQCKNKSEKLPQCDMKKTIHSLMRKFTPETQGDLVYENISSTLPLQNIDFLFEYGGQFDAQSPTTFYKFTSFYDDYVQYLKFMIDFSLDMPANKQVEAANQLQKLMYDLIDSTHLTMFSVNRQVSYFYGFHSEQTYQKLIATIEQVKAILSECKYFEDICEFIKKELIKRLDNILDKIKESTKKIKEKNCLAIPQEFTNDVEALMKTDIQYIDKVMRLQTNPRVTSTAQLPLKMIFSNQKNDFSFYYNDSTMRVLLRKIYNHFEKAIENPYLSEDFVNWVIKFHSSLIGAASQVRITPKGNLLEVEHRPDSIRPINLCLLAAKDLHLTTLKQDDSKELISLLKDLKMTLKSMENTDYILSVDPNEDIEDESQLEETTDFKQPGQKDRPLTSGDEEEEEDSSQEINPALLGAQLFRANRDPRNKMNILNAKAKLGDLDREREDKAHLQTTERESVQDLTIDANPNIKGQKNVVTRKAQLSKGRLGQEEDESRLSQVEDESGPSSQKGLIHEGPQDEQTFEDVSQTGKGLISILNKHLGENDIDDSKSQVEIKHRPQDEDIVDISGQKTHEKKSISGQNEFPQHISESEVKPNTQPIEEDTVDPKTKKFGSTQEDQNEPELDIENSMKGYFQKRIGKAAPQKEKITHTFVKKKRNPGPTDNEVEIGGKTSDIESQTLAEKVVSNIPGIKEIIEGQKHVRAPDEIEIDNSGIKNQSQIKGQGDFDMQGDESRGRLKEIKRLDQEEGSHVMSKNLKGTEGPSGRRINYEEDEEHPKNIVTEEELNLGPGNEKFGLQSSEADINPTFKRQRNIRKINGEIRPGKGTQDVEEDPLTDEIVEDEPTGLNGSGSNDILHSSTDRTSPVIKHKEIPSDEVIELGNKQGTNIFTQAAKQNPEKLAQILNIGGGHDRDSRVDSTTNLIESGDKPGMNIFTQAAKENPEKLAQILKIGGGHDKDSEIYSGEQVIESGDKPGMNIFTQAAERNPQKLAHILNIGGVLGRDGDIHSSQKQLKGLEYDTRENLELTDSEVNESNRTPNPQHKQTLDQDNPRQDIHHNQLGLQQITEDDGSPRGKQKNISGSDPKNKRGRQIEEEELEEGQTAGHQSSPQVKKTRKRRYLILVDYMDCTNCQDQEFIAFITAMKKQGTTMNKKYV